MARLQSRLAGRAYLPAVFDKEVVNLCLGNRLLATPFSHIHLLCCLRRKLLHCSLQRNASVTPKAVAVSIA